MRNFYIYFLKNLIYINKFEKEINLTGFYKIASNLKRVCLCLSGSYINNHEWNDSSLQPMLRQTGDIQDVHGDWTIY